MRFWGWGWGFVRGWGFGVVRVLWGVLLVVLLVVLLKDFIFYEFFILILYFHIFDRYFCLFY